MKYSGAGLYRLLMLGFFAALIGAGTKEARGASGLTFIAGTTNGLPGAQVVVPIRVTGFNNVNLFQFSIHWTPSLIGYVGVESFGLTGLTAGNFGTSMRSSGTLTLSWDEPRAMSPNLSAGAAIF